MAKTSLLLSLLLAALCFAVSAEYLDTVSVTPAMAPSPHNHHHHHHHYHSHPPTSTPSPSPAYPPSHGHHPHPHPHPPTSVPAAAPMHPPYQAPAHTPKPAPASPPKYNFPRSFVAVQGVVFCKSCKYAGAETLLNATAVHGATVKLQCNNTRYPIEAQGKTDKNGYFYIEAPKTITNYGAHKCKVFLVSSGSATCPKPSDLHGGYTGALLKPEKTFVSKKLPFVLFSVGPLAFNPKC